MVSSLFLPTGFFDVNTVPLSSFLTCSLQEQLSMSVNFPHPLPFPPLSPASTGQTRKPGHWRVCASVSC